MPDYEEKKKFYEFDNPALLPIIMGSVSLLGTAAVCVFRMVLKSKIKKKLKLKAEEQSKENVAQPQLSAHSLSDI